MAVMKRGSQQEPEILKFSQDYQPHVNAFDGEAGNENNQSGVNIDTFVDGQGVKRILNLNTATS